jgi:hypothetical protein
MRPGIDREQTAAYLVAEAIRIRLDGAGRAPGAPRR